MKDKKKKLYSITISAIFEFF